MSGLYEFEARSNESPFAGYCPTLVSLDPPGWLLSQGHPGQSFVLGMVVSVERLQRCLHSATPSSLQSSLEYLGAVTQTKQYFVVLMQKNFETSHFVTKHGWG